MAGGRGSAGRRENPAEHEHEHVVDDEVVAVVVRRSPRYGRFLMLGIVGGLLAAGILTANEALTGDPGGPLSTGASGFLRVFGALAAVCVALGLVLMAGLAIMLDRIVSRRVRPETAERETVLVDDLVSPVGDDPPRWAAEADDAAPNPPRRSGDGAADGPGDLAPDQRG